jgi:hypothetical protein
MVRPSGIVLSIILSGLLVGAAPAGHPAPELSARLISLTRTIRIPVKTLSGTDGPAAAQNAEPATLMIAPGAADERPEGPDGFDVLDDGSFLVTDPIRNRIAVFDSQGKFRQAWKIGFAADSVTALANGLTLVREARTGQSHVFSREGRALPSEPPVLPEPPVARILDDNRGIVNRPAIGNSQGGSLAIQFDRPGSALVSLEVLATDSGGNTYVALESTTGSREADEINVNKYVRKYAADGKLVDEIADIALDYYVTPVDELRVHRGIVYQLLTTNTEVRINVWDMK